MEGWHGMNNLEEAIGPVVRSWLAHPGGEPLVIQKAASGSLIVTRGMPRADINIGQAAKMLGMAYRTFRAHYLDSGILSLNSRGKVPAGELALLQERIRNGVEPRRKYARRAKQKVA